MNFVMVNSVNSYGVKNTQNNNLDVKTASKVNQTRANVEFGYGGYYQEPQSPFQGLKDLAVTLTNDVVGFLGVNAVLLGMQKFVNGNILIGKINKHFTKDITNEDNKKLIDVAIQMREKHDLHQGPKRVEILPGTNGEAYFTHVGNKVVVGQDQISSLFHEIGHAVEENKTTVLKQLQRFRGHYTELSLALYMLMSMRPKNKDNYYQEDQNQGVGSKIANFVSKSDAVIPLIAFAPELITEAKASQYGLKFLKSKIGDTKINPEMIEKSLYNKIKKSYLTCFATYLFIPVSIMLVDAIRNSANKAMQRRKAERNQFY